MLPAGQYYKIHYSKTLLAFSLTFSLTKFEFEQLNFSLSQYCLHIFICTLQLYRIQNKHLFEQYEAQKRRVMEELSLSDDQISTIEKRLWHGTDAESARNIYMGEFNRSFAGKNGEHELCWFW